ncbi:DUF1622 domain-containing protein [Stenotrophomonas sp. PS02289]|uniref:DUF1622 domain-containing protein n=1 Tax=Stenotrophomonas sp. PS02289 TaxID=2991422 RepID=UPI00249CA873|nr:DUF1622 domain-containing protein [Stenotrophomonas sp. PS02289]
MIDLHDLLVTITEPVVSVIELMALILIALATLKLFVQGLNLLVRGDADGDQRRSIWLEYGRWLVAGLSVQLAADILESAIYTSWDSIGQLAAIAVIRTFLNYFLEKDITEIRERQRRVRERRGGHAEAADSTVEAH